MTRRLLMAVVLLVHVCSTHCVAADYEDMPPTLGPWKGCEPGTYTVQKWVRRNNPLSEDGVEYRRIMLLGRTTNTYPGCGREIWFKSDSPDGPWTDPSGQVPGDWKQQNEGSFAQLPDETLTFERGTALCEVYQVDKTDDWGRHVETLWFSKESGLLLQLEISFDGVDDFGNPRNWSHRMETVRLETRVLKGKSFEVAVQREPYRMGKKVRDGIQETVKCAEIPGELVSRSIWATRDTSLPPITIKELLDWGVDREAREKYIEENPPYEVVRRQREKEKRIQEEKNREQALEMQREFWDGATAEAASLREPARHHGLMSIARVRGLDIPEERREEVLRLAREAVNDESLRVRRQAVLILARLEEPDSTELLIRMLDEDPEGAFRYVEALGGIGDPGVEETLTRTLEHEDGQVRLAAARELLKFDEERARTALADIATGDQDTFIRAQALGELAQKDDSRFRSALLAALRSDDESLRSSACVTLVWPGRDLNPELTAAVDLDPELTAAVLSLLDSDSWQVRMIAMALLGQHKVKEAAPKLIEFLQRDEPFLVKDEFFEAPMAYYVVTSLGSIGTPEAVATLLELLDDPDRRYFGVYGLLFCADPRAAEALWSLYRTGELRIDPQFEVSDRALLKSIAKGGDGNLLREIRSYLENEALPPEKAELRQTIQDLETRLTQETKPPDN